MRSRTTRDHSRNSASPAYTRSRSPSPYTRSSYRTRSRTPSYSDSFESEDEKPIKKTPRRTGLNPSKGGKRNAKKGAKDKSGKISPRMLDVVARRMLSAKRVKVNDLRNEVELLKQQIEELKRENKFLQLQSRRQEKELTKADSANTELPSLLERHNQELRAVKEHLRKVKDKYDHSHKRNKELDGNLSRVTAQLQKLKDLTEDKNLKEREVLTRRVNQLEDDVDERDRKIRDLERYIENLQKNHRHELSIEVHRHKETQKRLHGLESQLTTVESDLKEKEKILEIQNIYSQRVVRAPHHLNSSGSTPLHFPSRRQVKTSNSAEIGLTPREKAKLYEERRRQDERQKALNRAKKMQDSNSMQNISEIDNIVENDSNEGTDTEDALTREEEALREEERIERERREVEDRQLEEKCRERERKEEEERLQRERERKKEEEDRRREEEDERSRQEEERRRKEEEEAAARRRKEFEELQARDEEERKKKDALLAKLKSLDSGDNDKKTNDPKPVDKDEFFLTNRKSPESFQPTYAAPKHHLNDDEDESIPEIPTLDLATGQQSSGRRAKQQQQQQQQSNATAIQPVGGTTGGRNSSSTIHSSASSSSKKQYNFREQVENMHAGKPAYNDVTVPYLEKQRRESVSSTNGGEDDPFRVAVYGRRGSTRKPPPGPSATKNTTGADKQDREAEIMEELFGSSNATTGYEPSGRQKSNSRDASPAGFRTSSKPAEDTSSKLPWEMDDSGDRMLPRRASQPRNSLYSRRQASPPGVIDDIEELTL